MLPAAEGIAEGLIMEGLPLGGAKGGGLSLDAGIAAGWTALFRESEEERKEDAGCACPGRALSMSRSSKSSSTSEIIPSLGSESLTSSMRA